MKEIKELLRKLEPIIGEKAKKLWYLNLLSKDAKTRERDKMILRLLADKKSQIDFLENIRLAPPSPNKLEGEFHIGDVLYPEKEFAKFGLREEEFIKHVLITGMTGSGKTNLSFQILNELARKDKPFIVFDWKTNYSALKQLPGFKDLEVIRIGSVNSDFKFNPLIPPKGTETKYWMAMLVDVIKHAFFVAHGVEYFLRMGIDRLYEKYNIYNGGEYYPTFGNLDNILKSKYVKGREMLWMSSTKRVLASLTFSGMLGDVLDTPYQGNIERLLDKQVIFEMDNLATIEKIFFTEAFLLWLYEYRKQESQRECFKHCLIIEEAHHILSKKKEYSSGSETITETIIRMIREFGEGVIVIDQEPQKISDSIMANTNCKINFTLGNGKDITAIAKAMSLTSEEKRMIDKLKTGHAIVKTKRFDNPIHVRIPHIDIKKNKSR